MFSLHLQGLCVNIEGGEDGHCTCSGCLCPDGLVAHDSSCYPLMVTDSILTAWLGVYSMY